MNDTAGALTVQLCKKGPISKASLSDIHYSLSEGGPQCRRKLAPPLSHAENPMPKIDSKHSDLPPTTWNEYGFEGGIPRSTVQLRIMSVSAHDRKRDIHSPRRCSTSSSYTSI